MITSELLRHAIPRAGSRAEQFAQHLEAARRKYVGDNWHRVAMFLAQIAHESGSLAYVRELASGEAYEGRKDLGNTHSGDGPKFRGRGLLQVTGRYNYAACGQELGLPLLDQPELLEESEHAAMSAGWVWKSHGLGPLCEAHDPVLAVTKRLNGGTNGLEDRRERYQAAMTALKLHHSSPSLSQPAGATQPGSVVSPAPHQAPAPAAPSSIKEPAMAIPALVTAAASALLPLVIDLFKARGTKTSERNAEVVEAVGPTIIAIAKEVVGGGGNEQQVAESILASKDLQNQFRAQVALQWKDVEPFLTFEEESRSKAREFAEAMTSDGPAWRAMGYGAILLLLVLGIIYGGGYILSQVLFHSDTDSQTKGMIVGAIIAFITQVLSYFVGSSASSKQKDATIAEQAKR